MPAHPPIMPGDAAGLAEAARLLCAGKLVAFPTETVYGLGADATSDRAVAAIFEAKGRPSFNPLIVHLADSDRALTLVQSIPVAERLAEAFWPGALTLVLPRAPDCPVSLLASAGLDTLAVRVPSHPLAHRLLDAVDRPIAAPSANRSGRISPTRASHVAEEFDADTVALILDGGATEVGLESTVVGFDGAAPVLLRPGGIAAEQIERVAGPLRVSGSDPDAPTSPGQLESHYAPAKPLRLDVLDPGADEILLGFGPDVPAGAGTTLNLSPAGDLREAAANLFALLREADRTGCASIAVMPIPNRDLGRAINDRLLRAATPRT
ncbi:MAG: L-threonylcarbamoyladenylate synthase [Alphaproteobacteria bacterium]|nr:L-threonylcarbamoyladenylate synthase [Alphaproteobacteria bacterium]